MKVSVLDKNLWNKYLAILGVIGIFTSFITIFVTIKDDDKVLTGIIFLTLMILIFLYIWYQANQSKNISIKICLLYTSPSPRDRQKSRMPSSA